LKIYLPFKFQLLVGNIWFCYIFHCAFERAWIIEAPDWSGAWNPISKS